MDISFVLRQPFGQAARVDPDRPALCLGEEEPVTYREVARRVTVYANALSDIGVGHGDRVGLLLHNSIEYWLAYLATTRLGAIAVRLNFRLTAAELEYVIGDSGCSVLLAEPELLDRIESRRAALPVREYVASGGAAEPAAAWARPWSMLESGRDDALQAPFPDLDDPAMLMYTSGTTGRPKGALWTHGNTVWFAAMQLAEWGFGPDTASMVCGPLYHVGGIENFSLPALFAGGRVVFMRSGGFSAQSAVEVASRQGVTDLAMFPAMIYEMLQSPEAAQADLSGVRRIFTGGDPVLPWATELIRERYGWIDVVQVYGLTEGTPIAACSPAGLAFEHPRSVGRPLPFCEITVRDDTGEEVSAGTQGEIWTRSPANAAGYWNKPEATAETFVDGWCKTGDLGVVEESGLSITGRKKDMIRSGGENIYPAEVEDVLSRHPGIRDVAVIGIPDPVYLETVCAIVVLAEGAQLTEAELIEHCVAHLASFKKPRRVHFVDELPRTASSKVQKYLLRERFAD
jgi:fatty-acyl-CoA synthase